MDPMTDLGGVGSSTGVGVKRGHVCVFALHCFLGRRAVVDAANNLGSHQRTCVNQDIKVST